MWEDIKPNRYGPRVTWSGPPNFSDILYGYINEGVIDGLEGVKQVGWVPSESPSPIAFLDCSDASAYF